MLSDDPGLPGKYTFPPAAAAIPAGGYLVLDSAQLGFELNKGGETIRFSSSAGELLDSVVFGPQLLNFTIARSGTAWRLATPTPGTATTAVCSISPGKNLRINEWLGSNNIIVSGDFVELYNPDVLPVDLAGFRLSQDFRNEPSQNQFPPLSFIAGSGFLELKADGDSAAGADHLNFKISRIHDSIALLDPAGRVLDNVIVLPGNPDVSQGRTPDGSVASKYLALPTPGFSNNSDLSADTAVMNGLRITEIMFDPPGTGAEFIEFRNIAAAALTITGVSFDSGLTFTFPATTIPPGGYAVITQNLTTFASQYPGLPAVQWTSGRLDNNGETLRIATGTYGLGILDFRYEGNWYPETRAGASLAIVNPAAPRSTWSDQASWQPAQPSPGGPAPFGVLAPADSIVTLPQPASLRSWISPGIHPVGSITVLWRKVSGPGAVTFTAPANRITDASFSLPGIYELSITATPPGGGAVALDKVTIAAGEVYASWASRYLSSVSAANRLPGADPDNDGQFNLIEYVMGTPPTLASAGPEPILNQGRLALRYPVSKLIDPAVLIIPQIFGNLTSWREGGTYLNHFILEETATSAIHLAEAPEPASASPRTYLRLKVVIP